MPEMGEIGPEPEEGEPVEVELAMRQTEAQDKPNALREVAASFRDAAEKLEGCAGRWEEDYLQAATDASNIFHAIAQASYANSEALALDVVAYRSGLARALGKLN